MNLIYISGPPAVGKLTVATELAALTSYKLFHNHLSIDCVLPVFDFDSEPFWHLVNQIRNAVIAEAARSGTDLIFTNVYEHPGDLEEVERRLAAVEEAGGRCLLVQLKCSVEELEARVQSESRKLTSKLARLDLLRDVLIRYEVNTPIPGRESLIIDNTKLSARTVAEQIVAHYRL